MILNKNTHEVGEYFEFEGARAYKFCDNKIVTDTGFIYTLFKNTDPKAISMNPQGKGYLTVQYFDENGNEVNTYVHRIVAKAFLENLENFDVVDHINEDKTDNRVENLRWTTIRGNVDYYNFKDNRELQELKQENKCLLKLIRDLKEAKKEVERERNDLLKLKDTLIKDVEKALIAAKVEVSKYARQAEIESKYRNKLQDTAGKKFESVEAMVKAVGKPIMIDGTKFDTIREAARYLHSQEDVIASLDTIRKEMRKLVRGDREAWKYLNKYYIELG